MVYIEVLIDLLTMDPNFQRDIQVGHDDSQPIIQMTEGLMSFFA